MNYRAGQAFTIVLLVIATVGFLVPIWLPWYLCTYTANLPIGCVAKITQWYNLVQETCTDACALGWKCPNMTMNWAENCGGSGHCMRQFNIWQSSRGLGIAAAVTFAVVTLLYFIHVMMPHKLHSRWSLFLAKLALLAGLCSVAVFAIGLPVAYSQDTNEANGKPLGQNCGSTGLCASFVGQSTASYGGLLDLTYNWGPGNGWIVSLAALIFSAITIIVAYAVGRGGDGRAGYDLVR